MSCSGCRVLRKGCSDVCILRPSIGWIEGPEAQGHATVFVAKFFGRAGLLSSLSSLPESHRPALFRSLLYEACGRAVNPVTGAVGLLWSGNWDTCEAAVETVLRGGIPRPMMDQLDCDGDGLYELQAPKERERSPTLSDLDLCLSSRSPADRGAGRPSRRASTPSDESGMTSAESGGGEFGFEQPQLLNLFV